MTEGQFELVIGSIIILLVLFVWMTLYYRGRVSSKEGKSQEDRDAIIRMVARLDETSAKEIYKKAYQIRDEEVAAATENGEQPEQ